MFKTSLKSKLIIAVMIMFGVTAFMSCEKEIEESNKVPDASISDSDIIKLVNIQEKGVSNIH